MENQPYFKNVEDKEKEFKLSPHDQYSKVQNQANKTASPSSVANDKFINSVQFDWPKSSHGKEIHYQVGIE